MTVHIERERKFLLHDDSWKCLVTHVNNIKQGYLEDKRRIRLINDTRAIETIKKNIDYREKIYKAIEHAKQHTILLEYDNWFKDNIQKHWNPKILAPYIYPINIEPTKENPNNQLNLEWNLVNLGDLEIDLKRKTGRAYVLNSNGYEVREELSFDLSKDTEWKLLMQYLESIIPLEIGQIEEERDIDYEEALSLLSGKVLLEKNRHYVPMDKHTWEIDVFKNLDTPLTMAEIELSQSDETFFKPSWIGQELTGDKNFSNFNLIKRVNKTKKPQR